MNNFATLVLSLLAAVATVSAQQFDYIDHFSGCEDQTHTYWLMNSGQPSDQRLDCRGIGSTTRLAIVETKTENDCLVKYIVDELDTSTPIDFLIGYEELDTEGVWQWRRIGGETENETDYEHWDPNSPSGGVGIDCAVMTVGEALATSGRWIDVDCDGTTEYFAICENFSP